MHPSPPVHNVDMVPDHIAMASASTSHSTPQHAREGAPDAGDLLSKRAGHEGRKQHHLADTPDPQQRALEEGADLQRSQA